eukprot:NODE_2792_length_740_cov_152.787265_g1965_i0.p3 GENE.NODE_2792_length_740_cov_152.787265_g1965_i0~~NODE_2792_length_740_cov_152.787265_g1965_i0.p3  ORF type:complete len:67 (+),score=3.55 NODE_2792_length_740_cov_152.787265_g1965_i0:43-243(+)
MGHTRNRQTARGLHTTIRSVVHPPKVGFVVPKERKTAERTEGDGLYALRPRASSEKATERGGQAGG